MASSSSVSAHPGRAGQGRGKLVSNSALARVRACVRTCVDLSRPFRLSPNGSYIPVRVMEQGLGVLFGLVGVLVLALEFVS